VITNAGRASVVTNGGRVTKIKGESDEEVAIDAALLATGAKVPQMAAEFGIGIPDATNIALLIKTQPIRTQLRAVLNTPRVSLRHTPDGGLAVDAGWTESCIEVLNDGTYRMPTETIEELLAEASHVLAGRPPLSAATYSIGQRPVPGDGEPVLGQLGDIAGLYVAFTHSGATLALIIGELLAYEMITRQRHRLLAPFTPSRFH
jgi:glycine/D-amino acid oxidase-like deaminating enzyme